MNNLLKKIGRKGKDNEVNVYRNGNIWALAIEKYRFGEFSYAAAKANEDMEVYSQVDVTPSTTLAGIYETHGGYAAGSHISENLVPKIIEHARNWYGAVTDNNIRTAMCEIEKNFLDIAMRDHNIPDKEDICEAGSTCLIMTIYNKELYVGNLGDSRAIMGIQKRTKVLKRKKFAAEEITIDQNVNVDSVRQELIDQHPKDPNIVVRGEDGIWRIKRTIVQISRSIGDLYLKRSNIAMDHLHEPIQEPIVMSVPEVAVIKLQDHHKFVVLGSKELWANISNQDVVEIVADNPRSGIALKLVEKAIDLSLKKRETTSNESREGVVHADITVIVMFFDHALLNENQAVALSHKPFAEPDSSVWKRGPKSYYPPPPGDATTSKGKEIMK